MRLKLEVRAQWAIQNFWSKVASPETSLHVTLCEIVLVIKGAWEDILLDIRRYKPISLQLPDH